MLKPLKFYQYDYLYKLNDIIDEIVFISKGTVTFYIIFNDSEKEFKDFKKKTNFGEIEMCLNETLSYSVKVKSRVCEIFILKKEDFLKTSINFKDTIENFLQISLLKYLKLSNEKIIKIKEYKKLFNFIKNKNKQLKKREREKKKKEKEKNKSNKNIPNIPNKSFKYMKSKSIKSFGKMNKLSLNKQNNDNSSSNIKRLKNIKKSVSLNNSKTKRINKIELLNELSSKKSLTNKSLIKTSTNVNETNLEEIKEKIFENEQIDKIIYYLNSNNLNLEDNNDTITLLNKFKGENNITKKNKLLDKIGKRLKNILNKEE
jgi:hypothetical protein